MNNIASWSQDKRLWIVLALNLSMVGGLLTVGFLAHSLGVLAAGGDYISDAGAIMISIIALHISRKPGANPNAKAYAALVNVVFMLSVTAFITYSSIHRLSTHVDRIDGLPVFIMSAIGSLVMIFGAYVLAKGSSNDLNMKAVLLDTSADAAFGAGVAVVGLIVFFTDRYYFLDPLVALIISCVILFHAGLLLKQVIKELRP